jgi:HEAT repeat protein
VTQSEVHETFESLVQELADPSQQVAISKLVGLSGISGGERSSFERVWLEMDGMRRQRLIHELIDLAEDSVELNFDTVFLLALRDQQADVRRAAIQGLSEYEGRDLIEPLTELLRSDPDPGVRAETALALGRFVLRAELAALRNSDAERIEGALRQTFTDPTEPVEVRARALEGLGARSEDWVHDLIEDAFSSDDRRLRISAVHAMGRSADPSWLSSVLGQLDSDDAEMRFEAVVAAGSIEDPEATPYLVALVHDDDTEVQEAAINALGQIGGDDAKDALQELLSEGDERIAEAVTYALAEIDFAEDPLALDLPELL